MDSLDDLRVLGPSVGHLAAGHDFPAEDAKGPNVRLGGEAGVVEHFRRRPLNGELGPAVRSVLVVNHVTGQSEVGNLVVVGEQKETIFEEVVFRKDLNGRPYFRL